MGSGCCWRRLLRDAGGICEEGKCGTRGDKAKFQWRSFALQNAANVGPAERRPPARRVGESRNDADEPGLISQQRRDAEDAE